MITPKLLAGLTLVLFAGALGSACKPRKVVAVSSSDSMFSSAPVALPVGERDTIQEVVRAVHTPQPARAMPSRNNSSPEERPVAPARDTSAGSESASLLNLARGIDPEVSKDMLAQGKAIYQGACIKCHAFKDAKKFTPERWEKILLAMSPKARLTEEQARNLRIYTLAYQKL